MATSQPRRSLKSIIEAIPTQRDYVSDSYSESSNLEDEIEMPVQAIKPLPLTPLPISPQATIESASAAAKGREREVKTPATPKMGVFMRDQATSDKTDATLYFAVQWRKPQFKKHSKMAWLQLDIDVGADVCIVETWDGDANIKVEGNRIVMLDEDGNQMAITPVGEKIIRPEAEFRIGGYEIMVDHALQADQFKANTCILNRPKGSDSTTAYRATAFAKPFRPPIPKVDFTRQELTAGKGSSNVISPISEIRKATMPTPAAAQRAVAATSFYSNQSPKPKVERIVLGEKSNKERLEWGGALFNPHAPGAVVMPRPSEKLAKIKRTTLVDVVLDPVLGNLMREHQKEGVQFMYSCVMGMTDAEGEGCILADEMGLGKTLQTIALIYTMLKQSPFANQSSIIRKAIIVCPVTLVDNWRKEFKKWVDRRINVLVADGTDYRISSFVNNQYQQVLVIGYERLRKEIKELASCVPPIDLIVCDEGHRLKSKDNKTTKMFDALKTQRRIILSGTPVQNDLGEYWAMVNFACPGVLGKYQAFAKHYEKPILKSRTPGCPAKDVELGRERADDLGKLSKEFVLRRTAAVLENYLPPKYEYVVFVSPSPLQLSVLSRLLDPRIINTYIRGQGSQSLALIDVMRKISNSPLLLKKRDDDIIRSDDISTATSAALEAIPSNAYIDVVTASGKMLFLDKLLHSTYETTKEKVVVISNWTSTLDLIQGYCKTKRYSFLRLDGSTPAKQRQELVDRFNRDRTRQDTFVFLLSAKAGGMGLNLIGASRLVLFDSDWNPSTDLQAMARIHRDGQKRPVYIYRLLTTNAIDEKIYQRQITKTGLSDQMMDQAREEKQSKDSFSAAELRDIFTLNLETDGCQTHDLLGCQCTKDIRKPVDMDEQDLQFTLKTLSSESEDDDDLPKFVSANNYNPEPSPKHQRKVAKEQKNKLAALRHWTHIDTDESQSFRRIQDALLYNILFDEWKNDSIIADDNSGTSLVDDNESDIMYEEEDESESDGEIILPRKRKLEGHHNLSKRARAANEREASLIRKKYNLKNIAEGGGTGRVTFVFEKVSKSRSNL
ncbi:uncharacterized protein L203_100993 [Cryptococcus depauperatus CBS 7841]|uniref:DNA repair and recombination protein RAD54B n=1 Tax=Cryptococcus depauperatus CBS 7841 TaxID=1295531 RepID=A0AAJ8JP79_9TREE